MANPATHVSSFDGSAPGWATSGASRFSPAGGLWLEESTTNRSPNPMAYTSVTGWTGQGGATVTRVTGVAAVHPRGGMAIDSAVRVTATSTGSDIAVASITGVYTPSTPYALSCLVRGVGTGVGRTLRLTLLANNGVGVIKQEAVVLTGTFALADLMGALPASPTASSISMWLTISGGAAIGDVVEITAFQPETKAYPTSFCPQLDGAGNLLTGYAFTGTAHASTSTRAASSASISPAGILAPDTGSLAFRFRRLIDTGGTETLLECGTAGSGTDYLSISVNSSDKLVVSWNSDNAGAQTVTSTESIAVDTEYFVYTEWASGTMGLSIDNGDLVVGARDAVEGDWGVGELVLEAT